MSRRPLFALCLVWSVAGCYTAGSAWMSQPLPGEEEGDDFDLSEPLPPASAGAGTAGTPTGPAQIPKPGTARPAAAHEGKIVGRFRNTYYDFPSEADYDGDEVALMSQRCKPIRKVPRKFYEAVCVQGSGTLRTGATVSFAKRDCECAEVCPRTDQKICFDELDAAQFPWGRGATGKPITPLLTVAVDTDLIPIGTALFIPEYAGIPRDPEQSAVHDGCFVAQDRGVRVKGKHVDVFTGHESMTALWNGLVPSNAGVTVILDNPRCARADVPPTLPETAKGPEEKPD